MPNWLRVLGCRIRGIFGRRRLDEDFRQELDAHLGMLTEENLRRGMPPEEARRPARVRLGGITQLRETNREMWGLPWIETQFQDLRYGLRQLRRNPGFTIVAILTLTLGIGVNTAMFNLVNAMLIEPLPASKPSQLVELYTVRPVRSGLPYSLFSYPMVEEIARSQHVFSEVSAWTAPMLPIEVAGQTFPAGVMTVTGNYFPLLGLRPVIGRLLTTKEDAGPTPAPDVVINYRFWQTHYSGNPSALGKMLKINGHPFTIVGVAPKNFGGLLTGVSVDAWLPLKTTRNREDQGLYVTARLNRGVGIRQARTQLQTLWPSILAATAPERITAKQRADFLGQRIRVVPAKAGVLAYSLTPFRRPLIVLMCAAAIVFLIACLNLAGLMLSRMAAREHEMGVRTALGASRRRLIQQLLTESMILAGSGALLAIPLAVWVSHSLASFVWTGVTPLGLDLSLGTPVMALALAAGLLAGILIGLTPAWDAVRRAPSALLEENPHTLKGRSQQGLGKGLIALQLGLSFMLVVGAGLMTRSLRGLLSINPGFQTEGVLDLLLQPKPGGYRDFHPQTYYPHLIQELAALPGVRSVSLSVLGPVEPFEPREPVSTDSSDSIAGGPVDAVYEAVSPRFFQTLGIALLQGRDFEFSDDAHAPHVAIVSESLARRLFPSGHALGNLINVGTAPNQQNLRIVGIVGNANLYNVKVQKPPAVYLPFLQRQHPMAPSVEIRTAGSAQGLAALAKQRVDALGREYVFRAQTVQHAVSRSLAREQTVAALADGYGGLALLLAAIGLYGLLSYSVARRTHEIGLRMALGAQKGDVLKMVVGQGIWLVMIGVAIGIGAALAVTRFLSSLLYGVKPTDPLTFAAVSLILICVALLACYIPARRAAKVDPMVALRYE